MPVFIVYNLIYRLFYFAPNTIERSIKIKTNL